MEVFMEITDIEYHELVSNNTFGNQKLGIRIKTTPQTFEEDFKKLVLEVKIKLQEIIPKK